MNHPIASRCAALIGPLTAVIVAVAGCGEAFTLTGGTGGAGGAAASVGATSTSDVSSTSEASATSAVSSSAMSSTSSGSPGCVDSTACEDTQFCLKASCGAGAVGQCMPVAATHVLFEPVCGCDGVTYWNSNYVANTARSIHKMGVCNGSDTPAAKTCSPVKGCGGGQHCAYLKGKCTDLGSVNSCWVLPDNCEGTTVNEVACNDVQADTCESLCTIMNNEKPFVLVNPACTLP